MTAHWIDGYEKSATLACRRFVGSHTYEKIAEILCEVHNDFDLPQNKITSTVTDNASNFKKAFVEFPPPDDEDSEDGEEIQMADIATILATTHDTDNSYLPTSASQMCCTHTQPHWLDRCR